MRSEADGPHLTDRQDRADRVKVAARTTTLVQLLDVQVRGARCPQPVAALVVSSDSGSVSSASRLAAVAQLGGSLFVDVAAESSHLGSRRFCGGVTRGPEHEGSLGRRSGSRGTACASGRA